MLAAVHFQIVARFGAKQIKVVVANFVLAAKFVSAEPSVAKNCPQFLFRPGGFSAQNAGDGVGIHGGLI